MNRRFQLHGVLTTLFYSILASTSLSAADPAKTTLFDGTSLTGWDGDPRFWRVDDGAIVGQTTADINPSKNTFLIYRGGEFSDFDLTFSYQVQGFNSGVQYRSVDRGNWEVHGLQADFEAMCHPVNGRNVDQYSGMFFEERERMFLGQRGQVVIVRPVAEPDTKPEVEVVASVGDPAELESIIRRDGWNEYRVIANGNQFIHIINGRVMSIGIDEDPLHCRESGIIAFQLHKGPPMEIRIKNVSIRDLSQD